MAHSWVSKKTVVRGMTQAPPIVSTSELWQSELWLSNQAIYQLNKKHTASNPHTHTRTHTHTLIYTPMNTTGGSLTRRGIISPWEGGRVTELGYWYYSIAASLRQSLTPRSPLTIVPQKPERTPVLPLSCHLQRVPLTLSECLCLVYRHILEGYVKGRAPFRMNSTERNP